MPETSPNETIKVYARIRPPDKKKSRRHGTIQYSINGDGIKDLLHVNGIKMKDYGYIDNTVDEYSFKFEKIFDMDSTQNSVFDVTAKEVIDGVLQGYNGTIFAYGQTGSGKTFTMTGGADNFDDRGLIPRTITYIFNEINENIKNAVYTVRISYLEIYNNNGYDLLNDSNGNSKLDDLPKIKIYENDGVLSLSNIELKTINNEEDGLNLLFLGDTNRMICETPNNDTSSRSHCIFTIYIESQLNGSDIINISKLNLVDLAGSERVHKSKVNGNILNESIHINLSLHYLEQIIVALHEKINGKRAHVPYRNSLITTILRDSIGGNCKTIMISTLSMDINSIFESISTAKFSQRVALIKNNAVINKTIDPKILIKKLKLQNMNLKNEIDILRSQQNNDENINNNQVLNDEEINICKQFIQDYISNSNDENVLDVPIYDHRKICQCFYEFKQLILYNSHNSKYKQQVYTLKKQIKILNNHIKNKENEIKILTKFINKKVDKDKQVKTPTPVNTSDFLNNISSQELKQFHPVARVNAKSYEDLMNRNKHFPIFEKDCEISKFR